MRHGYIITVLQVIKIGEGKILPGRGEVLFSVVYKGLMFRPMVNEVVDAVVEVVLQVREGGRCARMWCV